MSTRRTFLSALLFTSSSFAAFAQNEAPVTPTVSVEGSTVASSVTRDRDTLSVDFPDEDIKTILRNVADLFELNLVVPDTLAGKASIKLRDVTWRQIFQVVLSPVGYTYIEEGNIIKVVSNESLTLEPVSTEVFILNNAKALDIKPTVDGLVDPAVGGKIFIDSRSNALVITERPTRMGRIRSIVEQLDRATDQVMIESKFVEVTDRDIRDIGVNWAGLQNLSLGAGQLSQTFNRGRGQSANNGQTSTTTASDGRNNDTTNTTGANTSRTVSNTYVANPTAIDPDNGGFGPTGTIDPATGALTGLSTPVPAQLGVAGFTPATETRNSTGAIVSTTPASFTSMNTVNNTAGNTTGATTSSGTTNSLSNTLSSLVGLSNDATTSRLASAVFSASDFNVVISALKSRTNTKVVSNPTVVTLNNSEAVLNIGQEFPIPNYTYNAERGSFEVSGFTYKPIGVILKVTPQVNSQGLIRLSLEPEISQQADQTTFGGAGGASIPIISTRKAKTNISLKNGYTVGIGGLMSSQQSHGGTKVPVLGSIPVLGRLFSSKSVNDNSTNLLIFITAKTVNSDGALPGEVFSATSLQATEMSPDQFRQHLETNERTDKKK